jgi:hypothetical protein
MTPQQRAIAIASRGVASVKIGDREHRYLDPQTILSAAAMAAADALDATYGGFLPVEIEDVGDSE